MNNKLYEEMCTYLYIESEGLEIINTKEGSVEDTVHSSLETSV